MKFITVRDLRTNPAGIWRDLPEEQEMIITNNGKPVALMTPVSDTDLEHTLDAVRRARAQSAVMQMQAGSIKNGTADMSADEIDKEIAAARSDK